MPPKPAELPVAKPHTGRLRWLWLGVAWVSLTIALIAVVVPGLPTTEFLLLATWASAKSSPRLHTWLWSHRLFGPLLQNWHNGRRVALGTKVSATLSMCLCAFLMWRSMPHEWWLLSILAGMATGNLWLWSRLTPHSTFTTDTDCEIAAFLEVNGPPIAPSTQQHDRRP
nr:YbaN family protein [Pseudomonas caricapapayae]